MSAKMFVMVLCPGTVNAETGSTYPFRKLKHMYEHLKYFLKKGRLGIDLNYSEINELL